jgi:hypothetical protein
MHACAATLQAAHQPVPNMKLWIARLLLLLGSVGFLVFGAMLLIQPISTMASIGFAVPAGIPATEIRAFYGGAELALGLLIGLCIFRHARLRDGLLLNGTVYGLVGLARLYGMIVDGSRSDFLSFALATELALGGLSLIVWFVLRPQPGR